MRAPKPPLALRKRQRQAAVWGDRELDGIIYGWMVAVRADRPRVPLGEVMVMCDTGGVLLGRVAGSLHRLEVAGRIVLHHGDLALVGAAFHRWLPTSQKDRPYVTAAPLG